MYCGQNVYLELSIALCVLEHVQEELSALLGPATLCPVELLGLEDTSTTVGFQHSKPTADYFTFNHLKLLRSYVIIFMGNPKVS